MSQKGSVPIIVFILCILVLLGSIVGGAMFIKQISPLALSPKLVSLPNTSQPTSNPVTTKPSPTYDSSKSRGPVWSGFCNQHQPGVLNLVFKDTVSVKDARKFITDILFNKYHISNTSKPIGTDQGVLNSELSKRYLTISHYYPEEISFTKDDTRNSQQIESLIKQIGSLYDQLTKDTRVSLVYGPKPAKYQGSRVFVVKLENRLTENEFLKTYPQLVRVSNNILVEGDQRQEDQKLFSKSDLYVYESLREEFELIREFPKDIEVTFEDFVKEFEFIFPESYSKSQIKETLKPLNVNYSSYDWSMTIRYRFEISPKDEEYWIKTFSEYPEIEYVEKAKRDCLE